MKTKKKYIKPVMEMLDAEIAPVMGTELSVNTGGNSSGEGYIYDPGDVFSRQNDFTITEDSDDDW